MLIYNVLYVFQFIRIAVLYSNNKHRFAYFGATVFSLMLLFLFSAFVLFFFGAGFFSIKPCI